MSETMTTTKVINKDNTMPANEKMVRSGVTGAVIGFLFGGPLLSALLGFGAAYASQKNDTVGEYARSLGDFGVSVRDRAVALDEKHQVVEKSSKAATEAWDRAKEYDGKYNILERTKDFAISKWQWFVGYVHENHLLERGVEITGKGYEYVAEKVGSTEKAIPKKED